MRVREKIYTALGYKVTYLKVPKFRGEGHAERCLVEKDGTTFFAFNDRDGLYPKIMQIQDSIPHMARFVEPAQGHILMEKADGELLWDLDAIPDQSLVEKGLIEFANATVANCLMHGDIRPWNVFQDSNGKITVIDWNLSDFLEADNPRRDLDLIDAKKLIALMRRETTFRAAWDHERPHYPKWCRPS